MRFLVMVKATKKSEDPTHPFSSVRSGDKPDYKLFADMGAFNDRLEKAGIVIEAADGLKPSVNGARVKFSRDDKRSVVEGPFMETKELVAGFWIWKAKSKEEAIEWVKKCPSPMPGEDCEIEIRPIFEAEDFAELLNPPTAAE